jgi:hypothetical protein|tara:strand:+ start:148 stop:429 length:282 start_codon:yes stop_codon:yes gene_type:complete
LRWELDAFSVRIKRPSGVICRSEVRCSRTRDALDLRREYCRRHDSSTPLLSALRRLSRSESACTTTICSSAPSFASIVAHSNRGDEERVLLTE